MSSHGARAAKRQAYRSAELTLTATRTSRVEDQMALGYDPFREYEQLAQQVLSGGRVPRSFPMDAYRRGEEFMVHLDLPGVDPGSIDITVESGMLTVSAERRFEQEDEDEIIVKGRSRVRFRFRPARPRARSNQEPKVREPLPSRPYEVSPKWLASSSRNVERGMSSGMRPLPLQVRHSSAGSPTTWPPRVTVST
jgi:HSP20 family molecular chaperone IbpA